MGVIDDTTTGPWQVIAPLAGTNYVPNPSFELDTGGWQTTNASLTRTLGAGMVGAYGGVVLAVNFLGGISIPVAYCPTLPNGTQIVASCWMKADSNIRFGADGGSASATFNHPADNQWHRLEVAFTMTSTHYVQLSALDMRVAGPYTNFYVDGFMIEIDRGASTMYFDGDMDGCSWMTVPHLSPSIRDGLDGRSTGQLYSLETLGLNVIGMQGIGVPDLSVGGQSRAMSDGMAYTGATAKERTITLLSEIYGSGTPASLHTKRAAIFNPLNPDLRAQRGPITLRYTTTTLAKRIYAYYERGFGWEKIDGADEKLPLQFRVPDPIWQGETQEAAALTISTTVSSVSRLALLSPLGVWSNIGGGADATSQITPYVGQSVRLPNGNIVVLSIGGSTGLVNFGGVAANDYLAQWNGSAWSLLGTPAPNSATGLQSLSLGSDGILYVGGLGTVGGVTVNGACYYTPSTDSWTALCSSALGGATPFVGCVCYQPSTGYLFAGGWFSSINGVTAANGAYYDGSWHAADSGLAGARPLLMTIGPDGLLYASDGATLIRWSGTTWSSIATVTGGAASIYSLLSANGRLYVAGDFTAIGGLSITNLAVYNGVTWSALGTGLAGGSVRSVASDRKGNIYAAGKGWTSVGNATPIDSIAVWNGSTWLPFAVDPPNTSTPANDAYVVYGYDDGSILVGWFSTTGTFGTSLSAQAITNVTNSGSANAYPLVIYDGAGQLYEIANLTTGQSLLFNGCTLASGERATLDMRPGKKTFTTPLRNLLPTVAPGSKLATFCLAPGVNRIAVYATGGTLNMRWTPRYWAVDS